MWYISFQFTSYFSGTTYEQYGNFEASKPISSYLEESDPEERINKVIELCDNDNIGKDENKLKETLLHYSASKGFEDII